MDFFRVGMFNWTPAVRMCRHAGLGSRICVAGVVVCKIRFVKGLLGKQLQSITRLLLEKSCADVPGPGLTGRSTGRQRRAAATKHSAVEASSKLASFAYAPLQDLLRNY